MKSVLIFRSFIVLGILILIAPFTNAKAQPVVKEWALLTYMNGFNNLDPFTSLDLNEMEKVGSTDRVHVVTQWASLKTKKVKRLYVTRDSNTGKVTSPVIERLGQADMGDYRTLIDFIKWAVKKYPAKHYFVNVWNHGTGWHRLDGVQSRDVSYDELSGNKITTEQLGFALTEASKEIGQKIDIFGTDSCLMAMAEVVSQMKWSVGTFIGSQAVEPDNGWPYDVLLSKWNEGGEKSSEDIANILTQVYVDSYTNGSDTTLSGMNLQHYSTFANAIRDFGNAIKNLPALGRQRVLAAVQLVHSYTSEDYKDLGDLVDWMSADSSISIRPEIYAAVRMALKDFVFVNHVNAGQFRSHGVSIWFPDTPWRYKDYKDRYESLAFNQDTAWMDAITATLESLLGPEVPAGSSLSSR